MLNTPILFLIFNRPDTTKQVFEKIRMVQPKVLFLAADGPRAGKEGEAAACAAARNIVLQNIDWPCEVKTLLREDNLGCGKAVSSAISWFFDAVEQGIILEDDTLPDTSFFPFCEELLIKYRQTENIKSVCGTNLISAVHTMEDSYLFSRHGGIWGWASWRRAWQGYDFEISLWNSAKVKRLFKERFPKQQYAFFEEVFGKIQKLDTWDYQWWFHRLLNDGMDVVPKVNLVKNIGFDAAATHTQATNNSINIMKAEKISFPLRHPKKIDYSHNYDLALSKKYYWINDTEPLPLMQKILARFKNA